MAKEKVIIEESGYVTHDTRLILNGCYVKANPGGQSIVRFLEKKAGSEISSVTTNAGVNQNHILPGIPFDNLYIDKGASNTDALVLFLDK